MRYLFLVALLTCGSAHAAFTNEPYQIVAGNAVTLTWDDAGTCKVIGGWGADTQPEATATWTSDVITVPRVHGFTILCGTVEHTTQVTVTAAPEIQQILPSCVAGATDDTIDLGNLGDCSGECRIVYSADPNGDPVVATTTLSTWTSPVLQKGLYTVMVERMDPLTGSGKFSAPIGVDVQ